MTIKNNPTVKTYFSPRDPNEAVLLAGPKIINVCFLALGAILMLWLMKLMKPESCQVLFPPAFIAA
jgi:hypothetical protein